LQDNIEANSFSSLDENEKYIIDRIQEVNNFPDLESALIKAKVQMVTSKIMPKSANDQKLRKTCITECIEMIGKSKHKFDNLTALAKYVALRVSEKELQNWNDEKSGVKPKPMAHQTLLTNKQYKKILLDFMRESEEDKHILDNPLVKATLLGKDLEIKSLKETVERLEKAIGEAYSTETTSDKIVSHDGSNDK
jgi:hypothetical protein